jgi:hypothetical protein
MWKLSPCIDIIDGGSDNKLAVCLLDEKGNNISEWMFPLRCVIGQRVTFIGVETQKSEGEGIS